MHKAEKISAKLFLNANIDGMIAFTVRAPVAFFLAFVTAFIFVAAGLVGFVGFGRGSNGILQKGLRSLNIRHGSGDDVLGQGVGDNRRWYRRNLHSSTPSADERNSNNSIIAYT